MYPINSLSYEKINTKKYVEALTYLETLGKSKDLHFSIKLRRHLLKLKCLFEQAQSNADAYDSLRDAQSVFRRMLSRCYKQGEINNDTKRSFLNFYNLLCKVAQPKYENQTLYKKLDDCNGLMVESEWIK